MFLGYRLKEQREKSGFSQQEIGDVLGISRSAIQKQESGRSRSIDTLSIELLAKKLGCSPAYLMGWTEDPSLGGIEKDTPTKVDPLPSNEAIGVAHAYDAASEKDRATVRLVLSVESSEYRLMTAAKGDGLREIVLTGADLAAARRSAKELKNMK